MFTNRPIYDSIRTCDVVLSQRGLCPVAKKPILEDRESDQSVAYFVSANFGLKLRFRRPEGRMLSEPARQRTQARHLRVRVDAPDNTPEPLGDERRDVGLGEPPQ